MQSTIDALIKERDEYANENKQLKQRVEELEKERKDGRCWHGLPKSYCSDDYAGMKEALHFCVEAIKVYDKCQLYGPADRARDLGKKARALAEPLVDGVDPPSPEGSGAAGEDSWKLYELGLQEFKKHKEECDGNEWEKIIRVAGEKVISRTLKCLKCGKEI